MFIVCVEMFSLVCDEIKRLLEIARKEKNIVSLIVLVFGLVSLKVT